MFPHLQPSHLFRRPIALICYCLALCCCNIVYGPFAIAQTWEYSPYKVLVWVAAEQSPLLPSYNVTHALTQLHNDSFAAMGYTWQTSCEAAPPSVAAHAIANHNNVSFTQLVTNEGKTPYADKVFTIAIRERANRFHISVREWDIATQQGGLLREYETAQVENIPQLMLHGLLDTFRVSAKIERVEGKSIQIRLRAGGLLTNAQSPASLHVGDLMQPIVRRNQRNGLPVEINGINAPAWSYLAIEKPVLLQESAAASETPIPETSSANPDMVAAESTTNSVPPALPTQFMTTLHSGFASIIPTKGSARTERYALQVKRYYAATEITVRAKREVLNPGESTPNKKPKFELYPLAEYEVFAKYLGEEKSQLLGLTDWRGHIKIASAENPLRILYIRNGGQFLARLPIVPGHIPAMTIDVLDDDLRLQAEAVVRALQSRVLDIVARREIFTFRIRAKISQRKFNEARELLAEFRKLPSRIDLQRDFSESRKQQKTSTNRITQNRVNKIFLEAEKMLTQFIPADTQDMLLREINDSEKMPPPSIPEESSELSEVDPTEKPTAPMSNETNSPASPPPIPTEP